MEYQNTEILSIAKGIFETEDITMSTSRGDVSSWDSLAHVMLISEIETKFKIGIPFEEISKIEKLQDLIKYIG